MFATLVLERDPLQWAQLPNAILSWLISAGGASTLILWLVTLAATLRTRGATNKRAEFGLGLLLLILFVVPFVFFFLWALLTSKKRWTPAEKDLNVPFLTLGTAFTLSLLYLAILIRLLVPASPLSTQVLVLVGGLGLGFLITPLAVSAITRMRWARIWALARLSLTDALRGRVALVFALMALVFLFADWFVRYKPEDQVRNYVRVVYWSMTPLFLMTATLLGAFSLPTDIKNQSIHTIVTKPVERLEIVLGRFLGFAILLTAGLFALSFVSYLYIWRGVTPEAKEESFKARVPIFGNLYFFSVNKKSDKGESVGREWGYRSYISGPHPSKPDTPPTYAVWEFEDLPANLGDEGGTVPFELTFDIFRLNKGEENKGVFCTFTFADGRLSVPEVERGRKIAREERNKLAERTTSKQPADVEEKLLEKYRLFEVGGVEVTDYHTQTLQVPAAFFKFLRELDQKAPRIGEPGNRPPALMITVNVDRISQSQLVGVARRDFYMLAAEQPFWQNFFKGILGMWFSFLLVLGIAIACSTYLSGVISWVCTLFLFGAGLFNDYIQDLALNRAVGGGPLEAARKLFTNTPITVPLDPTPASNLVKGFDEIYRRWLQLFLHIIPDVNRFDLHQYVANGFDIPWSQVLFLDNFVYLVAYLLPWMVLSYYLMKFREIANPT
jgi:hypothetical protein